MKTIVEPKKSISGLWGKQRTREKSVYRLMKYVIRVDHDDKVLLHNVVTGQLVVLDRDEVMAVDKLPLMFIPVLEQLVTEHFLVPEDFREYQSVNQLRRILRTRPSGTAINHYIILPTTFCNAHCFYCYESDYPRVHMTEETAFKIIDFIDGHWEGKNVTINWFGGEPLVGVQRIDQITNGLKERNISFTSSMVSNGYLFDRDIVERSVDAWNLQRIQITLDGTENTYNQVKAYVNVQDNPFQRVLRNIDLLSSNKIQVNIRLNVDFYNKDDIKKLIEYLGERYSNNNYVTVYLNMLFNDQGYEPVRHSYEDMITLSNIITDYTKRLKELNMSFDNLKYLDLTLNQCMADDPHTLLIQPDGSFCRCEHESILDSYGDLDNGTVNFKKLEEWKEIIEISDYCPECVVYPACYHLKQCMNSDLPCIEMFRTNNLEKQKERIRAMYVHKMEEEINESV